MNNHTFTGEDQVKSERFGIGSVILDNGETVIVRFEHGIEECEKADLTKILTPFQAIDRDKWDSPLEVITRCQAEAIQSVNDEWGVFSRSRIALLPHQLWVCRKVLSEWPMRWMIADDVGLGKTIEAGLILWPLLSKGTVKRLLIICPASLVEQWQYRLREMFDIRVAQYNPAVDTEKSDFWNTHDQVVASLQTLRADRRGRHDRLFGSDPWDLLIVDEAHHLNNEEKSGATQGYKLVDELVKEDRVNSMLFFTGTPHRGKNFGFLSLMSLLRPEWFNPHESLDDQLPKLSEIMIRNNKQTVTDLEGKRLFHSPIVNSETYSYSAQEAEFYEMLTDFILTGRTYASGLSSTEGRAVMLVLIAMQKLASSSVAAIRRALKKRLDRIIEVRHELHELLSKYEELEEAGDNDQISQLEEELPGLSVWLQLMEDEETRIKELIKASSAVSSETKIQKILALIKGKYPDRSVLFFTEYKATQSLLMSALMQKFGDESVTFINGDDQAKEVVDSSGMVRTIYEKRSSASDKFNNGSVRFLVSTEAGGEGIDLQENCHTLIHVDLPWNPMRLHQRVGRLLRYGQTKQVEVTTLRNPDTVESRIWDKLNEKIENIMLLVSQAMEEPEDLSELILGVASTPKLFREIFSEAQNVPQEKLSEWFDRKTAHFGGKDAIQTVSDLLGHTSKFDFKQVSDIIPKVDLPALRPFLESMLVLNGRRVTSREGISFKTPEEWRKEYGVRSSYQNMIFDRDDRSENAAQRILGVGHKIINQAILQAKSSGASVTTISTSLLEQPIFIFKITDRITSEERAIRTAIVGVESKDKLLRDWELLERLNALTPTRGPQMREQSAPPQDTSAVRSALDRARSSVEQSLKELSLPFKRPNVDVLAVLWPGSM